MPKKFIIGCNTCRIFFWNFFFIINCINRTFWFTSSTINTFFWINIELFSCCIKIRVFGLFTSAFWIIGPVDTVNRSYFYTRCITSTYTGICNDISHNFNGLYVVSFSKSIACKAKEILQLSSGEHLL